MPLFPFAFNIIRWGMINSKFVDFIVSLVLLILYFSQISKSTKQTFKKTFLSYHRLKPTFGPSNIVNILPWILVWFICSPVS